jgi:16S rRNA (cytosine967-C5)-methyltransferase
MNSREAAFLAVLSSLKGERFILSSLEEWRLQHTPSQQDYNLAYQIAYGTTQMSLALDYLAQQLSAKKKLHLKVKERVLLHTALYQMIFLERIPKYAVVDETMKIAKKYFHKFFLNFLNAILRKTADAKLTLPKGTDSQSLSIRFSYPQEFIVDLIQSYGLEKTIEILEEGNKPASVTARKRKEIADEFKVVVKDPLEIVQIPVDAVREVSQSENYYIQNTTPAFLIGTLAKDIKTPSSVLDLCASPGGKIIAIHDVFKKTELFANDVSEEKLQKLRENFKKYDLKVNLSCGLGQDFQSEQKFDLIILDVPCSNSGVLNKRPEARWRLNSEQKEQLEKIQTALIHRASQLLSPSGEIWYMTCSILPSENEMLISKVSKDLGLEVLQQELVLPKGDWDGGFAVRLKKN